MIRSDQFLGVPGYSAAAETFENEFTWGKALTRLIPGAQVSGAARDAGNTPTTVLRPGLLLGRIAASGLWKEYSATATDGSNYVEGVLMTGVRATDLDGNNANRFVPVMVGGPVQAARLVGLDHVARNQMRGRFVFDDDYANTRGWNIWHRETAKAASYTVVAADAGTLFTTAGASGAVTFTLPAKAAGLGPFLFLNVVDQNMVIASAGSLDDILADGDLAADTITFSTASRKIGSFAMLWCNAAGTLWHFANLGGTAATIA